MRGRKQIRKYSSLHPRSACQPCNFVACHCRQRRAHQTTPQVRGHLPLVVNIQVHIRGGRARQHHGRCEGGERRRRRTQALLSPRAAQELGQGGEVWGRNRALIKEQLSSAARGEGVPTKQQISDATGTLKAMQSHACYRTVCRTQQGAVHATWPLAVCSPLSRHPSLPLTRGSGSRVSVCCRCPSHVLLRRKCQSEGAALPPPSPSASLSSLLLAPGSLLLVRRRGPRCRRVSGASSEGAAEVTRADGNWWVQLPRLHSNKREK